MSLDFFPTIANREWREGKVEAVIEPATGDQIAEMVDVGEAGVDAAVSAAKDARRSWAATTPKDRAAALLRLADALEANADQFAELEARDVGKPLGDARAEMFSAADKYRFFAGAGRALTAPVCDEYKPGITSLVRREPLGIVAAIAPWNYPMGLTSWKIGPALMAGNTVVLKPTNETPLTSLLLGRIAVEIFPAGVLNVVTGGGDSVGRALVRHPDVAMVSLTGGTSTGKTIMRDAADMVKKVHLELGGKAPVLLFDDADLDKFVATMRGAAFRNSGQDCTAATRVYVSKALFGEVTERLVQMAEGLTVGNGFLDPSVQMGPVVSQRHRDSISRQVERAVGEGARIVTGGEGSGAFYTPTIVTGADQRSAIVQEELFGPVLVVSTFDDEDDAIAKANDVAYGLAASIWTRDINRAVKCAALIEAGTVWINDHGPTAAEMPFGGFKLSGLGRDMSIHAIEEHTALKHVAISHGYQL